jgi:hypothetical protein
MNAFVVSDVEEAVGHADILNIPIGGIGTEKVIEAAMVRYRGFALRTLRPNRFHSIAYCAIKRHRAFLLFKR